jgi:DNA-binding GntR family transcriptional regulator
MAKSRKEPHATGPNKEGAEPQRRRNRVNFFEVAYEQLEDMLVTCRLRPGQRLAMQDLQELTGLGRTPVHQAVNSLAAGTLILVHPRQGLQIAPIDLARERILLRLRRDLERFVVQLAAERSGPAHRNQVLHLERVLREHRNSLTLEEFNYYDRRIDSLILMVANEPFLEHTLRPLHTVFRRIGWLHHTYMSADLEIAGTIDRHLAVLNAVASAEVDRAIAASDELMDFVESMFERLEREIDPFFLDCSLEPLSLAS